MAADPTKPRLIELGALSLKLDPNGAFAREITCAGEELFRGIGFVVRDANWGTPALPATVAVAPLGEGFEAKASGRIEISGESLDWSVVWTIDAEGLEARAAFSSASGFSTNRTGFVVLHSLGASRGRPVRVSHPGGEVEETRFPDLVSPHQPFFDIAALEYRTSAGHRVDIVFAGEVFEIEDQRNWTDASYKTYCRPLSRPYPYRIEPGERVEQRIRLRLAMAPPRSGVVDDAPRVGAAAPLARLGTGIPPGSPAPDAGRALRDLGLAFTAVEIALDDPAWAQAAASAIAAAPGPVRLDLRRADLPAIEAALRALAPLLAGRDVVGISLFDAGDEAVAAARAAFPNAAIGAGTGAFFTELNRMTAWPAADYLCWTSNPTVHGFDDDTVGETTEPLGDILHTARAKLPVQRFQIGPLTLGLRFNPNATTPEGRRKSADPDPRQGTLIAAAWTLASIVGFHAPEVEAVAVFEPSGPKGLVDASGAMTPTGRLLARLAPYAGMPSQAVRWPHEPRAAGLLIEAGDARHLVVAFARHASASLPLPAGTWSAFTTLDSDGFVDQSAAGSLAFRDFGVAWLTGPPGKDR